jgi:hypothetical protein
MGLILQAAWCCTPLHALIGSYKYDDHLIGKVNILNSDMQLNCLLLSELLLSRTMFHAAFTRSGVGGLTRCNQLNIDPNHCIYCA